MISSAKKAIERGSKPSQSKKSSRGKIERAMNENNISCNNLAQRMKTSRSQIGRLLDPKHGNVTLATLQRAARMVGRSLRLELV